MAYKFWVLSMFKEFGIIGPNMSVAAPQAPMGG